MKTTALAYLRVSTDRQALGPQAQLEAIRVFAKTKGWAFDEARDVYRDEGVSGATPLEEREGLLSALARASEGDCVLVVAKRDRLARDVVVAAVIQRTFEKAGCEIHSADGVTSDNSPEGQLLRTLIDGFAQYERAMIRARVRAALAVKKRRGERVGSVPYGSRIDPENPKRLIAAPRELDAVMFIRERSRLPLREIARELEVAGIKPREGRWHPQKIARILAAVS